MSDSVKSRVDRLQTALNKLEPYVDHRKSCTSRSGTGPERDFCTCGVDDVVEEVDSAIRSLHTDNNQ